MQHCQRALEIEENPMVSRSYMYLGIGHSLLADEAKLRQDRQELQRKALKAFARSATATSLVYPSTVNKFEVTYLYMAGIS